LRLCAFARKKKYLEEEKFKFAFAARRPIRHGGQAGSAQKKDWRAKTLRRKEGWVSYPLREKKTAL